MTPKQTLRLIQITSVLWATLLLLIIIGGKAHAQETVHDGSEAPAWLPDLPRTPSKCGHWCTYNPVTHKWDRPARTNREVWDKPFTISHAVLLSSIVYDVELTHQGLAHHKCTEINNALPLRPSRSDMYMYTGLEFGAITGFDWLTKKARIPYVYLAGPVWGSAIHFGYGSTWPLECW